MAFAMAELSQMQMAKRMEALSKHMAHQQAPSFSMLSSRCVNYCAGVRGEALGICAPLALGGAEGAVGAACGAGVGLVSGLVEGGVHVEAGRRRHLDTDEVEALELDARDLAHCRDVPSPHRPRDDAGDAAEG